MKRVIFDDTPVQTFYMTWDCVVSQAFFMNDRNRLAFVSACYGLEDESTCFDETMHDERIIIFYIDDERITVALFNFGVTSSGSSSVLLFLAHILTIGLGLKTGWMSEV